MHGEFTVWAVHGWHAPCRHGLSHTLGSYTVSDFHFDNASIPSLFFPRKSFLCPFINRSCHFHNKRSHSCHFLVPFLGREEAMEDFFFLTALTFWLTKKWREIEIAEGETDEAHGQSLPWQWDGCPSQLEDSASYESPPRRRHAAASPPPRHSGVILQVVCLEGGWDAKTYSWVNLRS